MNPDLEIAKKAKILDIKEIADKAGIPDEYVEQYGKNKAKISLDFYKSLEKKNDGKLILVSAITPTPAGEGKTTTSIAIHDALNRIGKKSTLALREPSLGPVFGVKGGATGGGYSQVIPMEEINLHFTGDISAVEKAHNLIAAAIDNEINHKNIDLDLRRVTWKRVVDLNDRSLRNITIALGGKSNGYPRETGYDIAAASEIMAILCLAQSYSELKEMIGNILIGYSSKGKPVHVRDIEVHGAAAALLKDALKPNLVQTLENNPVFIHGGPFANIAQGTNSVVATKMALKMGDYTVTEAGFGFDLGAEKFFDIVGRKAGYHVDCAVIVATIRALKMHGEKPKKNLKEEDVDALTKGFSNLEKHIENAKAFGVPPVVAINVFESDSKKELETLEKLLNEKGIPFAYSNAWAKGGEGAEDLAKLLVKTIEKNNSNPKPLYELDEPIEDKICTVARTIYGAKAFSFTKTAKKQLKKIKKMGMDKYPVCIAKTQKSLSDDAKLLGRPKDFFITVREIEIAAGAGFLVPITGDIMRMPGLPKKAAYKSIDIDDDGEISGLF